MHFSGLIISTGHEKENSQTSKNIHKKKIDAIHFWESILLKQSAAVVRYFEGGAEGWLNEGVGGGEGGISGKHIETTI